MVAEPPTTIGSVMEQIFLTSSLVKFHMVVPLSPQHPCSVILAPPLPAVTSQLTQPTVEQSLQPVPLKIPNSNKGVTVAPLDVVPDTVYQQLPSLPKKVVPVPPDNKLGSTTATPDPPL